MNNKSAVATAAEDTEPPPPDAEDAVQAEAAASDEKAAPDEKTAPEEKTASAEKAVRAEQTAPDENAASTGKTARAAKADDADGPTEVSSAAATSVPPVTDAVSTDAESVVAEPDSDANDSDAAESPKPVGTPKRAWDWHRLIPAPVPAVLALLLIVAVVFASIFGWKLKDRDDRDSAARSALAAAQNYAVALTSIDSAHIDEDFATVLNGATGKFKDEYTQSADQLKPLLLQAKSVSKGHVVASGVQSASDDHVVVMLFVDAEITNVTNPQPRVDRNRILMTMDRVGNHWLASQVDLP